jgi:hypothetical protein
MKVGNYNNIEGDTTPDVYIKGTYGHYERDVYLELEDIKKGWYRVFSAVEWRYPDPEKFDQLQISYAIGVYGPKLVALTIKNSEK